MKKTTDAEAPIDHVWLVVSRCDCEHEYCDGHQDEAVFLSEQTARQEAERRSKEWGGWQGRPDMHVRKMPISTRVRSY